MRSVRQFGVILSMLAAGLLLANPAGAQPPGKLTDHITDTTGALTSSDRAEVSAAIDRLYRDRRIQLWVAYVDNFSRYKPDNWATQTRSASGMGNNDVLLAVATKTKAYAFSAPNTPGLSAEEVNNLRSQRIEPAVGSKDWSGAAVAAADGLDKQASPAKRNWLPIAIGVAVTAVILIVLFLLYRARRRRATPQVGPSGGQLNIEGPVNSLPLALSTADARMRQISDYIARHRQSIGTEAKARFDEAKQHLAAAHDRRNGDDSEAIAEANRASTLAAQAQTLANADVLGAHRTRRR